MCVLAMAWEPDARWRLVVAGNRDELHARPARPLQRWTETGGILAGKDLESGGSWLGVSEQGRFAVVTNLGGYGPPAPGRPSRGILLTDLLSGDGPYATPAQTDLAEFNPLNLIALIGGEPVFWTNRPEASRRVLGPGVYGLSNGALDEPWPKTVRLKAILSGWIEAGDLPPEALLDGLGEDTLPAPIFVRNPVYGTRCSTVVAVDRAGRGLIVERRFDAAGQPQGQTALPFAWPE